MHASKLGLRGIEGVEVTLVGASAPHSELREETEAAQPGKIRLRFMIEPFTTDLSASALGSQR